MLEDSDDPTLGASDPDRLWTFSNVAEACPLVMSPLCWTVWLPGNEVGFREAYHQLGILPKGEIRLPENPNERIASCFYGRLAINVDLLSTLISVIPGSSPEEFERDFLGYVREDRPPFERSHRRLPFMLGRLPALLARHNGRIQKVHAEQHAWWQREVLPARSRPPADLLRESAKRFHSAMRVHIITRSLLQPVQAQLGALAEQAGDPGLTLQIFAGVGDLAEAGLAADLWDVSRGSLELREFIRRHGYHGPSEGNPIGHSWREDPAVLGSLVDALKGRPDADSPRLREGRAKAAHDDAVTRLLAGLGRADRARAKMLLRAARRQVRALETGKASFLMGLDGARAAARQLGKDRVASGVYTDVDDAFYLTLDEHTLRPPADPAALIAFRRERREAYQAMDLPVTFTGMPEPVAVSPSVPGAVRPGSVIKGLAGSHGVAEGRVRVVLDPNGDETLEPDEILVCRITDPSWAALFTLAAALVIDIGAAASHGAIVAREMGIPCVIGTGDGTRQLTTGDLVRVDGGDGTVTVL